jgi:peptidoglycan L-alanyl-D-glutamate endopeptidase CwlK
MTYKYSRKSLDRLNTCHPDLQKIMKELIKLMDVTIIEGERSKEKQEELVRTGMSKTLNSKHLKQSDGYSHAVDAAPYPIDWNDREGFAYMQGMIRGIAHMMNIEVRSGIDWDADGKIKDHSFFDGPHVELRKK